MKYLCLVYLEEERLKEVQDRECQACGDAFRQSGVLVAAITDSRSTFEQYHALVAAERSVGRLSSQDRARVREAVESVLAGSLGDTSTDRRTVARRLLEELDRGDGTPRQAGT